MTSIDFFFLPWYKKVFIKLGNFFKALGKGLFGFILAIPKGIWMLIKNIGLFFLGLGKTFARGDFATKISFVIMGFGSIVRKQFIKGLLFLSVEIGYFYYMVKTGWNDMLGLKSLGTKQQGWAFDEELGIEILQDGDNSMKFLLFGILSVMVTIAFVTFWRISISSAYETQLIKKKGGKVNNFIDDVKDFFDQKLYKTLLFLPITGVLLFTILPLIYMISIAFTNYDSVHQPPGNLFSWVGIENFKVMFSSNSVLGSTFFPILIWTIIWAVVATFGNYILGMLLAMLINKKDIKFKAFWRTIFVLSIAVPQFVSLLLMRNLLNNDGAINMLLLDLGLITEKIRFLSDPLLAKFTIVLVNFWVGIPYSMLITTGILMNIPADLYESARIDGASPYIMFKKITLPYMLFVTAPYLITQFIGNLNNFNIIYLLSGGGPSNLDYYQAGHTDLLVTWLYKLTVNSKDYNYASTIGIIVFVLSAVFSLITYRNSKSYNNEEEFQ